MYLEGAPASQSVASRPMGCTHASDALVLDDWPSFPTARHRLPRAEGNGRHSDIGAPHWHIHTLRKRV